MATIIDVNSKRRMVKMSVDDILCVISQYQTLINSKYDYEKIRDVLSQNAFYLPEDL
ncbi:hypothetical protein J6Q66_07695 [bacterium]|nr:hypothetical protein [bacterium]